MPFDRQPTLFGRSVTLRPLQSNDRAELYDVARDPLIWDQHPDPDRYQRERFDAFFDDAIGSGGALAILDHSGRLIGSTRFHGYNPDTSEIEIGWTFLTRTHWGTGTNRAAKELMLDHAFRTVERVVFLVGPHNRRSQQAVEKLGAERVGHRDDGTGPPSVLYELRRPAA